MLVAPYRVWARRAGEDVFKWMRSLGKEWIANGPGQAAEAAAQQAAADARALLVADQQTAQLVQQLPSPMGSEAPLVYPHKQMSFRLRNTIFSFGGRMARPAQHMKSIPPRILYLIERWQM